MICLALGAWHYSAEITHWELIRHPTWEFGKHDIRAEVISEPEHYSDKSTCDIRIRVLDGTLVDATARLSIYRDDYEENTQASIDRTNLHYGDVISGGVRLNPPTQQSNPYAFDYHNYLTARKIGFLAGSYSGDQFALLERDKGNIVLCTAFALRRSFSHFMDNNTPPQDAQLAKSVFLGMREAVSDENEEYFRRAGVMHILVVSGQNLTMIAFLIFTLLGLTGLHRRWAALCTIPFIIFYALLTGSDPPVVRAAIMATIVLIGLFLGKKPPLGNAIGATALFVLIASPLMLFDASFVLSFSATAGIAFFMPFFGRLLKFLPGFLRTIFSATLGAQVAVYPFIAFYFFRLATYSLPANLIIVPLSDLFMLVVGIMIGVGYLIPVIAGLAGQLVGWVAWLLTMAANFFAQLPASEIRVGRPSPLFIVIFLFTITALINFRGKWRIWSSIAGAILVISLFTLPAITRWIEPKAEGIFLDIGQADGSVLITAHNKVWVIDTGDKYSRHSAAEYSMIPYLKGRAISRIDFVVLSHGHKDHTGGFFDLINEFDVGTVLLPATADLNEYSWRAILAQCQSKGIAVRYINDEVWKIAEDDEEIAVVEPFPDANPPNKEKRENLHSLAVIFKHNKAQVLWTGDLERAGMVHFIRSFHCRPLLVKAPHHGSNDSGWEWIWVLKPSLVVFQASARAKKVTADNMQAWLDEANIPVVNTGVDGALEWSSDGAKFNARSYLSGRCWEWKLNELGCGVVQRLARYLEIIPEYKL